MIELVSPDRRRNVMVATGYFSLISEKTEVCSMFRVEGDGMSVVLIITDAPHHFTVRQHVAPRLEYVALVASLDEMLSVLTSTDYDVMSHVI